MRSRSSSWQGPPSQMRIAIDACCLSNGRGYGRYTRELLRGLFALRPDEEWICFLDRESAEHFELDGPNVRVVIVDQDRPPSRAAAADGYRSPVDMLRLTRVVWRERPDVFFSPSVYTYFPLPPGLPAVVTIHDTIPERFPQLTLPSRRARLFWRGKVWLALRQASLVLTVSDYSAEQIRTILGVKPERIRVADNAPASIFTPSDSQEDIQAAAAGVGLPEGARWFIYVGGFNPHKRVDSIIRAHASLVRERGSSAPYLLLVGTRSADVFHSEVTRLDSLVAALGTDSHVRWAGWVDDAPLRHLYSGAVALLQPSEAEGYGLPAVEAAACGAPVVATRESPLPSVLEGGGIWVTPSELDELEAAMRFLLDDAVARRQMGSKAAQRAAALSWHRSAEVALRALREAAA